MKKQHALFKKAGWMAAIVLMAAVIFSSCKKDEVKQPPVAGLMVYNLVPDQDALGVAIGGNALMRTPLLYNNYSGIYLSVYAGSRTIQSYLFGSGTVLASNTENFKDSAYYSLFVTGTEGHYKNIFVNDPLDSLPTNTGNAFVRYINAVTDSMPYNVAISAGVNPVLTETSVPGHVSAFKPVTPGDVHIAIASEDNSTEEARTISLEKNGIYTVLISGTPGATDTAKAVKIKYIQNGNVIP